ncbi:MAG: phytanoyl-CoA dioxygenase family protein [Ignavibacterium sp.]|nr:phytanoyl-CoA dioxygenase family protein [Ignavibacterium sp.]
MVKLKGITESDAVSILNSDISSELKEYFNSKFTVKEESVSFYSKNGFVRIENVVEKEFLNEVKKIIQSAVLIRKGKDERELKEKSQYEQSFLQCGYLCWDFPAVKEFVFSKRFAGIARDLMKAKHVRLWHDQALFKEPGGRMTDAHQDCSYWPINEPQFTITMWLALTDVPVEKGCLYFYPQTNRNELIEYVDIFKNPHQPEKLKNLEKVFVPLKAGDATFHSGLTFHGAGNNQTSQMRTAMTIIYIKDGVTFNSADERNKTHTSCIGLNHNDIIDTKYTPILI